MGNVQPNNTFKKHKISIWEYGQVLSKKEPEYFKKKLELKKVNKNVKTEILLFSHISKLCIFFLPDATTVLAHSVFSMLKLS